ncbi:MAG: Glu/Leu/Phe/Val dehydrogenase [Myxococcales bacterium]|nr:Glu/Leu/Phe/Val dehydrogenase [Myxococcales bacterium]
MPSEPLSLGDELGPAQILHLRDPEVGLSAIVVVDNVAAGPSIGGIRMAPDVDLDEVFRLARAMTFKNAAAGLPHGGGKAGIIADPKRPAAEREQLVRRFARLIRGLESYIPGPDMGTDERSMAFIHDEIGRAVGLPRVLGGIPLDEIGATGLGLAAAADIAAPRAGIELSGARVAVQGFGAVGIHAARYLAERGARLVAASDSRGAIENPDGLDLDALWTHKREAPVADFSGGRAIERDAVLGIDCDILIPAARPDVLGAHNADAVGAKLILQGANIPATDEAEARLHERGVLNIPDFIANAGGVICASVEYHGGDESQARAVIQSKISRNVEEVFHIMDERGLSPRQAAIALARERVEEAMGYRTSGGF